MADTTVYSFSGRYYTAAGAAQTYTGTFSITDPAPSTYRPMEVPDAANVYPSTVWQGTSDLFTGAVDLQITFASGTVISASQMDIVVNNTTYQGAGSPYPEGLSVQMYPRGGIQVAAPTANVCATPDGVCGEDDDPLYHDANQSALMATDAIYFAFYGAPQAQFSGVPVLTDFFGPNQGGLGMRSGPTTTLTSFTSFDSQTTVSPVPEPGTLALFTAGLLGVGWLRRQRRQ